MAKRSWLLKNRVYLNLPFSKVAELTELIYCLMIFFMAALLQDRNKGFIQKTAVLNFMVKKIKESLSTGNKIELRFSTTYLKYILK
jgi:hypothetical protein